eukprot:SAG31_NODE_1398_length_8501_cov_5.407046_11_plen_488_part_00
MKHATLEWKIKEKQLEISTAAVFAHFSQAIAYFHTKFNTPHCASAQKLLCVPRGARIGRRSRLARSGAAAMLPPMLLLSAAAAAAAAPRQKMIMLDGDEAGDSRCLDGSPYAFYIIPGSTDSFSIGIHGGGWCYDEIACLDRSKMELGSSRQWNLTSCFHPPAFSCYGMPNCTMVFMPYCDGSSFTSHRAQPWPVPNSTDALYFRGRANLQRTLEVLKRDFGLGHAREVVVSGGSAGGLTTYLNLDYIAEAIPNARVVGMPVAGYFLDHPRAPFAAPIPPFPQPGYLGSYPASIKYMFMMFHSSTQLSSKCRAAFAPAGEEYKCLMAPYAVEFISSRFFAVQSRFDEWQLGPGIANVPCLLGQTYSPPYKTDTIHVCNSTERDYIVQYGADFMRQFAPVLSPKNTANGLFLVSCIQHGIDAAINGITLLDAFKSWHTGGSLGKNSTYKFIDSCGNAGDTPCNAGSGCAPPHMTPPADPTTLLVLSST